MLPASNAVVGMPFGAPRHARDQRRKIITIAAQAAAAGCTGLRTVPLRCVRRNMYGVPLPTRRARWRLMSMRS